MKRIFILLGVLFAAAPLARGQVYSGIVLYSLGSDGTSITFPSISPNQWEASAGGQTVGYGQPNNGSSSFNGVVWSTSGASVISSQYNNQLYGTDGTQQVGYADVYNPQTRTTSEHAAVWSGTAFSGVDLNPLPALGITRSEAYGVGGGQQVGIGISASGTPSALLWTGTAASAVNLNPAGYAGSAAYGTDGTQQVGTAGSSDSPHAMLWSGTAASAVDLNPGNLLGFTSSRAFGVAGNEQVGVVDSALNEDYDVTHAVLWTGTSASAVDLNPTSLGFGNSYAYGTNGTVQVGYGFNTAPGATPSQALVWSGSAASAVALQNFLSFGGNWSSSFACTVNALGDIYGIANATPSAGGTTCAVEWFPDLSWAAGGNGNWGSSSNWGSQNVPGPGIGAYFSTGSATGYAVTLAGNSTPNNITVIGDNVTIQKGGYSLSVPYAVTITGTAGQPALLALAGAGTSTFGSLSISNGQLDITDNAVVITYALGYPSPVETIGAYVASGYNGGAWNGAGIVSSKVVAVNAASGNPNLYGIGYADGSDAAVRNDHFAQGTVIVEPALVGDANLDGVVNYADFQLLAANMNGVGTSWDQGDFNFAGTTNFTDFQLLAANFNDSTSLDSAQFVAMNQFAEKFGDRLVANADGVGFTIVPEPGEVALLVVVGIGMVWRRRRGHGD